MAPSIPSAITPRAFVGHCKCPTVGSAHTYKSPRWGSWKSANADPWDKIILVINDESDNWLADPNGVSNSKGSWDFQDYETI